MLQVGSFTYYQGYSLTNGNGCKVIAQHSLVFVSIRARSGDVAFISICMIHKTDLQGS